MSMFRGAPLRRVFLLVLSTGVVQAAEPPSVPKEAGPSLLCPEILAGCTESFSATDDGAVAAIASYFFDIREPLHVLWALQLSRAHHTSLLSLPFQPVGLEAPRIGYIAALVEALSLLGPYGEGELARLAERLRRTDAVTRRFRQALLAYLGDATFASLEGVREFSFMQGVDRWTDWRVRLRVAYENSIPSRFFLPLGVHSDDTQFYLGAVASRLEHPGPLTESERVDRAVLRWRKMAARKWWRNSSSRTSAFLSNGADAYRAENLRLGDLLRIVPFLDGQPSPGRTEDILRSLASAFHWTGTQKLEARRLMNRLVKKGASPDEFRSMRFEKSLSDFLSLAWPWSDAGGYSNYRRAADSLSRVEKPDLDTSIFLLPFFGEDASNVWNEIDPSHLVGRVEVTAMLFLDALREIAPEFVTATRTAQAIHQWEQLEDRLSRDLRRLRKLRQRPSELRKELLHLLPWP